jgi:hypothetical protein
MSPAPRRWRRATAESRPARSRSAARSSPIWSGRASPRWPASSARKASTEIVYLITSLPPEAASPQRLLRLARDHWGIENRLHYVRDIAFAEDRCRVRAGARPLASLRNFAIANLVSLRRSAQARWRASSSESQHIGVRPAEHFLWRIRVSEEYGPENCRWARRAG